MATQNTIFYQYLEAAFRYRLFNPKGTTSTPDTPFSYLGYNLPFKRIFYYARKVLPKFYTSEFPDTEEGNLQMARKVLEKLDKHQDLELENQFKSSATTTDNDQVIATAQTESQAAEQQPAPAGTTTGAGGGIPGIPSAPTISSAPRAPHIVIQNIPHTPEKPQPSQLVTTTSSGMVKEAGEPSKLVTASSSGAIKEAPPSKIYITNKGGVVTGEKSISPTRGFRFPSSFTNISKNLGSRIGVFFQRNVGKYLTVGRIATGVSGGIGAITGGALTNGSAVGILGGGGLGALAPSWIRSGGATKFLGKVGNGTINVGVGISNQVSMGATRLSAGSASKKLAVGLIGALFFLVIGAGLIGGLPGTSPPGEPEPTPSNGSSGLDYTLPLRDKNINPLDIRATIKNQWPNAQIDNWQIIIDQAIANNWNPALVLALWIEESGAQGENSYSDALGCAPGQPTTDINISLTCLFNNFSDFTNDQFPQFMARYSGGPPENPFANNPNFPKNFKNWYSQLVPSGSGAITINYKKRVQDFNISINDGFVPEVYKWADEVLASTTTVAPKFKTLLGTDPIKVKPTCKISTTNGRVISLRNRKEFCRDSDKDGPTAREDLFKQVFTHELGHIINGSRRPGKYGDQIKSIIAADGYLTAYSENAATADDKICGDGDLNTDLNTRADEDFAESVSYFVNKGIKEQNYGCGTRLDQNPIYAQDNNRSLYPEHYQLMVDLLR